jgi:hypothetical protein
MEDWSTAWESYFTYRHGLSNVFGVARLPATKQNHLVQFFESLE